MIFLTLFGRKFYIVLDNTRNVELETCSLVTAQVFVRTDKDTFFLFACDKS